MPKYTAPVRDTQFILTEVLGIEKYSNLPGFDNAAPDVLSAVLEEAGKFVEEVLFPLNQVGDQQGCTRHPDGSVTTPMASRKRISNIVRRVGAHLLRPKSSADRACRMSSALRSRSSCRRATWRLPCIPA